MADVSMQRKLLAILSDDVKGYSKLMGDDDEATVNTMEGDMKNKAQYFRTVIAIIIVSTLFITLQNASAQDYDSRINDLEARIAVLEKKLKNLTVSNAQINGMPGPHFIITGANLHVRNGIGKTDSINGAGNLIVGYNEVRPGNSNKSGSHNIVVGTEHNFSSYGGLVVARNNSIIGPYASVTGGVYNQATNESSVSGGINNQAGTTGVTFCSVSGGSGNKALGGAASVSGGLENTASGNFASISGGKLNTASGSSSSVSAGRYNVASGDYSFVGGGGDSEPVYGNEAFSHYSAIIGGRSNTAGDKSNANHSAGQQATVSGGAGNKAIGVYSSVFGGELNKAAQYGTTISGGQYNTASGKLASISGGGNNTSGGYVSSVSGGQNNTASGDFSGVSAGRYNVASGDHSFVGGGGGSVSWGGNEAFSHFSAILGGAINITGDKSKPGDKTIGQGAIICGGTLNIARGAYSSAIGGTSNKTSGSSSVVIGGKDTISSGDYDTAVQYLVIQGQ